MMAGLKKVEMFLVSADGQKPSGTATLSGENEYEFDEMIQYKEGDKGFKVKAEDAYGYTTIATLPVTPVLLWFASPTTYACTYIFPAFVRLGFVVVQLPQLLLFLLVL